MATKAGQSPDDPSAVIYEAYRMDGITEGECRTIFLDWALKQPNDDPRDTILRLLDQYDQPDHPMTAVLKAGLVTPEKPGRRGGRAGRVQT